MRLGGREIGTSAEHPFWVVGRGWLAANELRVGDRVVGWDGQETVLEGVVDADEYAVVYNLRVADYHTYFVRASEWGFSVWAHNASCQGGAHENGSKPKGDGLDSHHMPASSISPLDANKGPAIKMSSLDHQATSSYGNGLAAQQYRAHIKDLLDRGEWRKAMAIENKDVRRAAQEVSGDVSKYNQPMKEMLVYAKSEGLLNK